MERNSGKPVTRQKRPPVRRPRRWQVVSELLPELTPESRRILDLLPEALEKVWPLRRHRRELPANIRELSAMLTCQRSELRHNYWNKPEWISAYLYYFLPWNLVRLCRLLPSLPLGSPEPRSDSSLPLLLDAGSGPLTVPLALWISRPEWRCLPVSLFALDASKQPLELGKALFASLGHLLDQPVWHTDFSTGPLEELARRAPHKNSAGVPLHPWLVTAANVLNELKSASQMQSEGSSDVFSRMLTAWAPLWQNGARLLYIEPGTRLGGATIMRLREAAIEAGLHPLSPCTHSRNCPLLETERPGLPRTWCHFIFSAQEAPDWLKDLSRKAGLFKTSLTLSPLLLTKESCAPRKGPLPCRVISQSFPVQGGTARYSCTADGLGLMPDSRSACSGSLCMAAPGKERDGKSGAIILQPATI